MKDKKYGSGYFGEWIDDEFGQPAYRYTCNQTKDPAAVTLVNPKWRAATEHLHQVGNDRLVAVASNYGYVQVRQDEGTPKYLNDYCPREKQYAGGFGFLTDGKNTLSTFYTGNAERFERIFGAGYFQKKVEADNYTVDQAIFAPFGDDPLIISRVNVSNRGSAPADLRWVEYWGARIYQFSFKAFLMAALTRDFGEAVAIRRRFSKAYLQEIKALDGGRGLLSEASFQGWSEEEAEAWEQTQKVLSSLPVTGMSADSFTAPIPEITFEDPAPPPVFLVSLDAPAEGMETSASRFFGEGGPENPGGLQVPFTREISNVDESAMLLERRFKLAPGSSKTLYFAYGYLPHGFSLDELLSRYSADLDELLPRSCESWSKDRVLLAVPDEPWVEREMKWHNYYLRGNLTYDAFFKEHILSQGHVYQYVFGFQGAARDQMQHALPFIYSQPWITRETIRYTLKEVFPDGDIPYAITGNGMIMPAAFKPSDSGLWLLWLASEYVLATRDKAFLEEKVNPYPAEGARPEAESINELLHRCYRHLVEVTGCGEHGLLRLSNGDWNDSVVLGHASLDQHALIKERAESLLNAAMSTYALDLYARLLKFAGETERAAEVFRKAEAQRDAVRAHWNGRWFKRAWLGPEIGWIGDEELWLEPQPWAIIGGCAAGEQAEKLARNIDLLVRRSSPIGAMLQNQSIEGMVKQGGQAGVLTNGGVWPSINGTLIWALALLNGPMAWDEWKKNTLAHHAEIYPQIWYGIWSGPDSYNSVLSSWPGQTQIDPSLLPGAEPDSFSAYQYKGMGWTDFPVMNMHPHAWPLYSTIKLLGAEFTPEGLDLSPCLPLDEYKFSSPLLGFEKTRNGFSGWYAPLEEGVWKISLKLNDQEIQAVKSLNVNNKAEALAIEDGAVVISGAGGSGRPLRWQLDK